jgi:hypothetical protein
MAMNQIETQDELTTLNGERALVDIWRREIDNSKKYHEKSKKIAKEFQDIYESQDDEINNSVYSKITDYPIFWSNTQVLKPLLFSKLPKANITQSFFNEDEISRISSELVERLLTYLLKESNSENQIEKIRDAFLVQGIGIPRVVFVPPQPIEIKTKKKKEPKENEKSVDSESKDMAEGETEDAEEETTDYEVDDSQKSFKIEFVDYQDFLKSTEKEWDKLRWVAFRKYYTRKELVEYFGKKGETVPMTNNKYEMLEEQNEDLYKLCEVWEVWDKENKVCHFITFAGDGYVLDTQEDGYNLKNFFPIPMPMGLNETKKLLPAPLYKKYKRIAEDLAEIHDRITSLVKQARFTGAYTSFAEQSDVENIMNGEDGEFKPLKTTANIDDARKLVVFKPLTEIANTITVLRSEKLQLKADIQEITGLSDIVRGYSVASETATAQQLKGNFAISRIQPLQKEVEFTIRDTLRLLAELAVEKMPINEIIKITGLKVVDIDLILQNAKQNIEIEKQEAIKMLNPEQPDFKDKVAMLEQQAQLGIQNTYKDLQKQLKGYFIELKNVPKLTKNIKNDKLRCISIDIETDSTVKIDQNQEKMDRMEYVRSISQTIQSMVPAVQTGVISKDALNEFIIFVSKPFKVGRNLENYLKVEEPIEEKPDPQAMLAQAEMQFRQQELQLKAQEVIGKLDLEQQKVNVDKAKVLNDQNKFEMQMEFDDVNKQADREAKRLDMKVKAGTELVNDQIRNANKPTKI